MAKIYANEPSVETMDESPTNMPGAYPEQQDSFTMSGIRAVDEAPMSPAVPESNQTRVPFTMSNIEVLDVAPTIATVVDGSPLDTGENGPAVQSAPEGVTDESWIHIPYVFDLNNLTESIQCY